MKAPSQGLSSSGSARRFVIAVAGALALALASTPARAQAVYGSVAGTVTDRQGGVLPGVTITIRSVDRDLTDSVVSNASGFYEKGQLLPGVYEVRAELASFKPVKVSHVVVNVDTQTKVNFTLDLGGITEEVVVTAAEGQLLKTDRADVSTVLGTEQVTELPVIDRNFTKFLLLTPGTSRLGWNHATSENPQGSTQTMVNGQHFSGTDYQLDGTDNRDPVLGIIVINPNLEAVGETKITSQNYDAEFGQAVAGVVSVQTKSGTNELHGSLFEFRQSDRFQARNPFTQPADQDLPKTKRDQFGGAIGGPIQKNKWFFFADYQGLRSQVGGSKLLTVPTALARTGDLSEYGVNIYDPATGDPSQRQQFPGNVIPSDRLSQPALAILNLLPLPNTTGRDNGTRDNYIASGSESFDSNAFDVRLDGRLSSRANVFVRYSLAKFNKDSPTAFGDAGGGPGFVEDQGGLSKSTDHSLAAGLDYQLSSSSVLEVRFGFFQYKVDVLPRDYGATPAADAGIPGLNLDAFSSGLFAGFIQGNMADINFGSGLGVNRCNCPLAENEKQAQLAVNFTKLLGNHTFKAGVDVRRAYNLRVPSDSHRSGELTFNGNRTIGPNGGGLGLATFLLGDVTFFKRYVSPTTDARERQWRHFYYVQDTWRASDKVTLNYGLRATIINPQTVNAPGNGGWLDQTTGQILVGGEGDVNLAGNVKNKLNWEPRAGITYQLNDKTVVRAGYGRSHDIGVFGSTFGHSVTQNLPVLAIQELNAPSNFDRVFNLKDGPPPPTFVTPDSSGRFALPDGINSFVLPFEQRLVQLDAWNLTIQREVTNDLSAEIGYVGNHSGRTFAEDNPDENNNQATLVGFPDVPQNDRKPYYDQFGWTQGFRALLNDATNSYHSLQAKVTKRYSHGWSLVASYTLARARQYANDYFWIDRSVNYGKPGWHRNQQFVAALTWELPFLKGNTILGGWQINANTTISSGVPFEITYRDAGQDRDTGPNRPDLIGDPQIGSGDGINSPYFNVTPIGTDGSAFGRPGIATFGSLERNRYFGPGYWNVDASLFKRFTIADKSLELRLEVQNLFNHVNLGNPNGEIGVPGNNNLSAGIINSTAANSLQRNLQFAVRFLF